MPKTNAFAPAERPNIKTFLANRENVVEHAGSGFELPESTARLLDERAKELPKDFTYRRLAASPSEFDLPDGERTDVSFITTDAVDRDGEVVLPQGIDWKHYNGCVPPFHNYRELPVGVNWWIRPRMAGSNNGLVAKTYYPTKPEDWGDGTPWLPSAILHLMQMPIPVCTGKSIGFLPLEIRNATQEERDRRPDWKDKPIISRALGLEYSVVSIPSNPLAELEAVSKGVQSGAVAKEFADLIAKALKDYGGEEMTESMPSCPKCMKPDAVMRKEGGGYTCKACNLDFTPGNDHDADDDKKAADEAAKALEARIAEALGAPFVDAQQYAMLRRRQMEVTAQQVERSAKRAIDLAIAAVAGRC